MFSKYTQRYWIKPGSRGSWNKEERASIALKEKGGWEVNSSANMPRIKASMCEARHGEQTTKWTAIRLFDEIKVPSWAQCGHSGICYLSLINYILEMATRSLRRRHVVFEKNVLWRRLLAGQYLQTNKNNSNHCFHLLIHSEAVLENMKDYVLSNIV